MSWGENVAGGRARELLADILVVGAGTAGMTAAVTAAIRGSSVIVIEKNAYVGGEGLISACGANFGGGTDYQKQAGIHDTPDAFYDDMRRWDPKADPNVLRAFCDNGVTTCHFLRDQGVEWALAPAVSTADMGMNVTRVHMVVGKGPAFYAVMTPALLRHGGTILLNTKGLQLLHDDSGRVVGLLARDYQGTVAIRAKSIMLSCGGFEGNVELVTRYVSPEANYAMLRGLPTNTGDGLLMGLAAGAGTRAMHRIHGYLHLPPEPVIYPLHPYAMVAPDGTIPLPDFVQDFPYGIVVNGRGERFVDETVPRLGENICNALVQQPGSVGYAVMDHPLFAERWEKQVAHTNRYWQNLDLGAVKVVTAPSLESLAEQLEFNPSAFAAMVREYNEAVDDGTTHLLKVPKANRDPLGYYAAQGIDFLRQIATPPFWAVKIIAGLSHTAGGLTIDASCRVLDREGAIIEGLYAGGDTSVLWHSNYGSAYACALVMGHLAGQHMSSTR